MDDGQDGLQFLLIPVDGVDDGAAVARPKAGFDGFDIGRIDLQRQGHHPLHRRHDLSHHGRFIDPRKADVDIQDIRTGIRLFDGTLDDIVQIVLPQSLLEPFLSGGVDPFTNDTDPLQFRHMSGGTYAVPLISLPLGRRRDHFAEVPDKFRIGAAASAHDGNTQFRVRSHLLCKFLRSDAVGSGSGIRKACVGFYDNGPVRPGDHLFDDGDQLSGTQRAVDAHGVHAQCIQRAGHGGHSGPGKGPSALLKGHGGPHRKVGVLPGGKHACPHFLQVGLRLKDHQVGSGLFPGDDHLFIHLIGFLECQRSQRFHQFSDGPHVQSDFHGIPCRPAGGPDVGGNDFRRRVSGAFQFMSVGFEGVGIDDIASRLNVFPVDLLHDLGMLHPVDLRMITRLQAAGLQHGAHASVQYDSVTHDRSLLLFEIHRCGRDCTLRIRMRGVPAVPPRCR